MVYNAYEQSRIPDDYWRLRIVDDSHRECGIAFGLDNYVYFTENSTDKIGRVDNVFGTYAELALTAGTSPFHIVRGPDGNMWFTEFLASKIGRLNTSCFCLTGEFLTLTPNAYPVGITVGADGALWFTESQQDKIGRITTGGVVTEYRAQHTGTGMKDITSAPDGSLWVTEPNNRQIGHFVY